MMYCTSRYVTIRPAVTSPMPYRHQQQKRHPHRDQQHRPCRCGVQSHARVAKSYESKSSTRPASSPPPRNRGALTEPLTAAPTAGKTPSISGSYSPPASPLAANTVPLKDSTQLLPDERKQKVRHTVARQFGDLAKHRRKDPRRHQWLQITQIIPNAVCLYRSLISRPRAAQHQIHRKLPHLHARFNADHLSTGRIINASAFARSAHSLQLPPQLQSVNPSTSSYSARFHRIRCTRAFQHGAWPLTSGATNFRADRATTFRLRAR